MEQIIELVDVIEILKKDIIDYDALFPKLDGFNDVKKKYQNIDWNFLYLVKEKSREEIDKWIDICLKTVHVL